MMDRIALVVNTLSGGGAEMTAANLSRKMSGRYAVDFIVNDSVNLQYPHEGRIISLGMPAEKNRMGAVYQIKALVRRTRILKKLKKNQNYKATLSFSEMTNLANVLSGGKAIISVHNSVKNSLASGWKHRLVIKYVFPFCFRRAYRTVACSREISDELVNSYGLAKDRSITVYNGIDIEKIKEKAAMPLPEALCKEDEILIVSVGRLTRQKGHWHLIRAIRKLREDGIPVKLIILGEGDLRTSLEQLIAGAGLEKIVLLPGFVENPYQFMANADAVVFPSLFEGFSNAIAEALACGAPVISTDHETGAREILAPDTDYHEKVHNRIDEARYGLLIPVCDGNWHNADEALSKEEKLMAEAIYRIIKDLELTEHYRQAALDRAEQLKIEMISQQWIRLIES